MNLDRLVSALFIGDISSAGRPINVVVWLELRLINHVIAVIKLDPVVLRLHHLLLMVHLSLLLLLILLLREAIFITLLLTIHLL